MPLPCHKKYIGLENQTFLRKRNFPGKYLTPLLIVNIFILSFSCKKDDKNVLPQIEIISLSTTNVFTYDTLHFKIKITDEDGISNAGVNVQTLSGNPTSIGFSFQPSGTSYIAEGDLIFDDVTLSSGQYQLQFFASDGKETSKLLQNINYGAIQASFRKLILIMADDTLSYSIATTDSLYGSLTVSATVNSDFTDAALDNNHQSFITMGRVNGGISFRDALSLNEFYNVPDSSTGFPVFNRCISYSNGFFVSCFNSVIKGFDFLGNGNFITNTGNGTPNLVAYDDGKIYVSVSDVTTGHSLQVFDAITQQAIGGVSLTYPPDQLVALPGEGIFLFDHGSGSLKVQRYNFSSNSLQFILSSPEVCTDAVADGSSRIYLSGVNGVFIFNPQQNTLGVLQSGFSCNTIAINSFYNHILAATNTVVLVIDKASGNTVFNIPTPKPVKKILVSGY